MERFSTSGVIKNPEWLKEAKNETSRLENKFYFKTSEDNQNGFSDGYRANRFRLLLYKVLVLDQPWKRHVDQIHQTDNSNVQIVAQMLADSKLQ